MNVYIYLDESGHIHKNAKTQYFAIGGFLVCEQYKEKILKKYKKVNLKIKTTKKLNKDFELKGSNMEVEDKIKFFNAIQDIETFCGIGIVFDKEKMYKEISDENIADIFHLYSRQFEHSYINFEYVIEHMETDDLYGDAVLLGILNNMWLSEK